MGLDWPDTGNASYCSLGSAYVGVSWCWGNSWSESQTGQLQKVQRSFKSWLRAPCQQMHFFSHVCGSKRPAFKKMIKSKGQKKKNPSHVWIRLSSQTPMSSDLKLLGDIMPLRLLYGSYYICDSCFVFFEEEWQFGSSIPQYCVIVFFALAVPLCQTYGRWRTRAHLGGCLEPKIRERNDYLWKLNSQRQMHETLSWLLDGTRCVVSN